MALKDLTNPRTIIVLNEAYEREKYLRSRWVQKHGEGLQRASTLKREPTNYYEEDVVKHKMIGGLPTITRDNAEAKYHRRKKPINDNRNLPGFKDIKHTHSLVNIGIGDAKMDPRLARPDTDLSCDPIMRPIDSKVARILTKPCPEFGRQVYLKNREKLIPEQRYYLPECTSWDYGWRLKDSVRPFKSQFARSLVLKRNLASRVGPNPDPIHYYDPLAPIYAKCALLNL